MKEKEVYWIWSSKIPQVGPIIWKRLIEKYQTIERIFYLSKEELMKVKGVGEKLAESILKAENRTNIERELQELKKRKIKVIGIEDPHYPQKLKNIYDPPVCIYVRGNSDILEEKSIAMVGSREPTIYGRKVARKLAYDLAKSHINVISGMAKGIDTDSHIGALLAKGKTIAVLGSGIDYIYPKENEKIYEEILKRKGAIVSEYGLGTKPSKFSFPARNRIISALSDGVLVVEAAEKSGTLITVDFALEQGKEVFAVPGEIDKQTSAGTNQLLKEGATLVTDIKDILSNG